jgi:hypothetical protein
VSGGSKLAKITDGAVSFDGTATTKLRVPDSTDFSFGTNDFCIEYFYYNNSLDGTYNIIFDNIDSNRSGVQLSMFTSNHYSIEVGDGSNNWIWKTTGDFPATENQWVHFALTRDGNTFRAFENGVLLGTQTSSTAVGNPRAAAIGGYSADDSTNYGFNGYISNFRIVNGSSVYTSRFTPPSAPLTNVTNTKLLCCQSNTSATEAAVIPTGSITAEGNAAATNFNPFITDINTVRGQETGYPTFNPLDSALTLSDGNLNSGTSGASSWKHCRANMAMTTGKFYWEFKAPGPAVPDGNNGYQMGVMLNTVSLTADPNSASTGMYTRQHTTKYANGSSSTPFADAAGKTVMFALDVDAGLMWTGQDGVWYNSGNPVAGTNESWSSVPAGVLPMAGSYGSSFSVDVNFGQKPFKFPPPDGFQPLNTANTRPETVIARPDQYVGITTWNGTGATNSITGLNFGTKPDFVWIKKRTGGSARSHQLFDSIRGVHETFHTDGNGAEDTNSNRLTAFNRDGFTVGDDDGSNGSGGTFIAWCWKAGGEPTATNTQSSGAMTANSVSVDGALQSAYTPSGSPTIYPKKMSVGTKQGFSIVQYVGNDTAGATLPHGLTKAPDFFVTKADYASREWQAYHQALGNQQPIRLNETSAAQAAHVSYFNNTSPTANVVTFGNGGDANQGGETPLTYIMYAWHDVPGLQKFGSYEGNGNADGPYVELGFKPALLVVKNADTGGTSRNWAIIDSTRSYANVGNHTLAWNLNSAESAFGDGSSVFGSSNKIDLLSSGFKIRDSGVFGNESGDTYIYMAWAEAPSVDLFGGGANAR